MGCAGNVGDVYLRECQKVIVHAKDACVTVRKAGGK